MPEAIDWSKELKPTASPLPAAPAATAPPKAIDWHAELHSQPIDWGKELQLGKKSHDPGFLQRIEAGVQWGANSPVGRFADATLNAPSRLTTGFIAGMGTPEGPFARAGRSVMDPAHATETTHEAERNLHLPQPSNPWLKAGEDILTESVLDPTIVVPGWNAFSLAGKGLKAAGVTEKLAQVAAHPEVEKALSYVSEPFKSGRGLTREGVDLTKGELMASESRAAHGEQAAIELIEKHRPALEAVDAQRSEIRARMDDVDRQLADITGPGTHVIPGKTDVLQAEKQQLEDDYTAAKQGIPPEIRRAFQQRIYREGTSEARRKALAAGYLPEPGEESLKPLNIVHKFEDEYEPEQRLLTKEEEEAIRQRGPLEVVRQGNRKATFDIEKQGSMPTDPLADRMLARLVKGVRLEEYHRSRRNILGGMGLEAGRTENIARAEAAAKQAAEAGDTTRAARYTALAEKQRAASASAAQRRAATIKPGTPEAEQGLEYLDPITARQRALRQAQRTGAETLGVGARTALTGTQRLAGRVQGGLRGLTDVKRMGKGAEALTARGVATAQTVEQRAKGALWNQVQRQQAKVDTLKALIAKAQGNVARGTGMASAKALSSMVDNLQKMEAQLAPMRAAVEREAQSTAGIRTPERPGFAHGVSDAFLKRNRTPEATSRLLGHEGERVPIATTKLRPAEGDLPAGQATHEKTELTGISQIYGPVVGRLQQVATTLEKMPVTPERTRALVQIKGLAERALRAPAKTADVAEKHGHQLLAAAKKAMSDVAHATNDPSAAKALAELERFSVGFGRSVGAAYKAGVKQAGQITRPVAGLAGAIGREEQRGQGIAGKAMERVGGLGEKYAEKQAVNETVEAMRAEGKTLQDEMNNVRMPAPLQQKLFGEQRKIQRTFLALFSDMQRHALFIMPFAHMKNISVLTMLGPGGLATLRQGLKYFYTLQRNPEQLAQRIRGLEQIGARQHFAGAAKGRFFEKAPVVGKHLKTLADWSAKQLEEYDTAMRLATQDALETRGITGFKAGGQIRDGLGDYVNQSELTQELSRRWGANFPGWGLQIVPQAMFKALREQPKAVKTYARTSRVLSQDVTEPTMGTEFDAGGPGEDYFHMLLNLPSYAASPSRIGLPALVFGAKDAMNRGQVGRLVEEQAARLIPGASAVGSFAHWPFPTQAPPIASGIAGTAGAYFPRGTSSIEDRKYRADQLRSLHYSAGETNAILRSEGYFDVPSP